jgi:predicted nucleotidyltransferase
MRHEIHRVTSFAKLADFTLRVEFGDGTYQVIDFRPVLAGELFGPLADPRLFDEVRLDPEAQTLVWPNGADFDPAMLHDWPEVEPELRRLVATWHDPPAADLVSRLRLLLPELREKYHVAEVAVFGSRARTDATPRSDLDLLVTFDPEASLFDLVGIELDLTERLGLEVDVVTPASIKPRIKEKILESAVPV